MTKNKGSETVSGFLTLFLSHPFPSVEAFPSLFLCYVPPRQVQTHVQMLTQAPHLAASLALKFPGESVW